MTAAGLPNQDMCLEIVQGVWPQPAMSEFEQSSVGQAFGETQTAHIIDCHWFGGYGYLGATFSTGPHDTQDTEFVDDAEPQQNLDAIVDFSRIGFGVPGDTQCPVPAGACCPPTGICELRPEMDCVLPSIWHGDWVSCNPNPCQPAPDVSIMPWGSNSYGLPDVPAPNVDFVAIAGGGWHSLGIKSDGSVVAWGFNSVGQCDVPTSISGFMAVAGGAAHSLGLRGPIPGACCQTGGTCTITDQDHCRPPFYWLGSGAFCVPNPCSAPSGLLDPPALSWSVGPNPSRASVRFVPPGPGRVRIEIFDAAGRLRRVLKQTSSGQPIEWDGRDDAGRPLASGTYLCRLESGFVKETRRINLVR